MLVKDYMTRHPLMAEPEMSVVEAQRYMAENRIRHLPIVGDGKRFLGLVTRERLLMDPTRLASLDIWEILRSVSDITVGDVMVKADDVVTIGPEVTIEEAARVMVTRNIGSLPVLEENIVVGIITDSHIMAQLSEMMVAKPTIPNVRVTVRMPNERGELAKLVAVVASQGWAILACGGVLCAKDPTKWDAVVKLSSVTKEQAVPVLEKNEGHEILDVREAQP